jgi:nicotinamide-nucleotide amidase
MHELNHLAQQLAAALLQRHQTLAVAESCTGGWVAKVLTDLPGSSRWFDRGFVTYSNAAKQEMLGVSAATLDVAGAVSEATVREMAAGVLQHSPADMALAISGIAGPGGAIPGKPVGTVCFAWATRVGLQLMETVQFAGDRDAVRRQSVARALRGLIDVSESV